MSFILNYVFEAVNDIMHFWCTFKNFLQILVGHLTLVQKHWNDARGRCRMQMRNGMRLPATTGATHEDRPVTCDMRELARPRLALTVRINKGRFASFSHSLTSRLDFKTAVNNRYFKTTWNRVCLFYYFI